MAILAFQKPEKVIMLESTSSFGRFEFRPLEPGFGMTVGNALRRILLSSLEGYAITTVKVAGVDHEFAAIPGVMEGMLEIILNLKQVRFIKTVESADSEKVRVSVAGQTELTAGYISNFLTNFKVLNPDLVICRLDADVKAANRVDGRPRAAVTCPPRRTVPPTRSSVCCRSTRSTRRSRT